MSIPMSAMTRLAWRNLWRNYRRTIIMLLAIMVGVWAMIFTNALLRGMVEGMIFHGISGLPGHVQVHHPLYRDDPSVENSIAQPDGEFLAALDNPVVTAWGGRIKVPAMISSERESRGITLLAVDPAREIQLGFDPKSIVAGRFLEGPDDQGLVVGARLLERLETRLGKKVVVLSQNPDNEVADRGFRIVGVFKASLPGLEESQIYAGLETVQKLLDIPGLVSEIAFLGNDHDDIDGLYQLVRSKAPVESEVLTWPELNEFLALSRTMFEAFVAIWIVLVFLALSFGLVNTFMMAVFERVREFGLMQALGMRPAAILYQVLLESLMLLAIGMLAGDFLAIVTINAMQGGIDLSASAEAMELMGTGSTLIPVLLKSDLILANVVVLILGLLTSLLPAWRASQYRPVEAIAKT
jgi:ABC-type lipoprotein release transport system permease subunit